MFYFDTFHDTFVIECKLNWKLDFSILYYVCVCVCVEWN